MNRKLFDFMKKYNNLETPYNLLDISQVGINYKRQKDLFNYADVFYAVKANPSEHVIKELVRYGSSFDIASINELDLCLRCGTTPDKISYGNTIKKSSQIKDAFERGVTLYAFDSINELIKLSKNAPGSKVFCRILTDNTGADYPLNNKFGCSMAMAIDLLKQAKDLNLVPYGVSFHVGSQQTLTNQWNSPINLCLKIFKILAEYGIDLKMINLGGGLPIKYAGRIPEMSEYSKNIYESLRSCFGENIPQIIMEPGRSMMSDVGMIVSEVILVSVKDKKSSERWVYLDVGKFGGLIETMDECIKYQMMVIDNDCSEESDVIIAGPTCDSYDVMYMSRKYKMPNDLKEGDKVVIYNTGAYTTTYCSTFFNGFVPLREIIVQ